MPIFEIRACFKGAQDLYWGVEADNETEAALKIYNDPNHPEEGYIPANRPYHDSAELPYRVTVKKVRG